MKASLLRSPQPAAPSLKEIVQPVLPLLARVEQRLAAIANEGEGVLKESSRYVVSGGGKRLRAALVLFCSDPAKDERAVEQRVEVAAAVELIHSATLVHDDIIDRAVLRRLRSTVNLQFGDEVAVLLGDFLYARAFEMVAQVGDKDITTWMARTTRDMCEGEIDQLKHRYRPDLSLPDYFSFIERKTASLIATCAQAGARLGQRGAEAESALHSFGLNIGIAFQIIDDVLDIVGTESKIGKTLHTDAGNGKMTLPFILLLQKLEGAERERLARMLGSANMDWEFALSRFKSHGILERSDQVADEYFEKALAAIGGFAPDFRSHLERLARFTLQRDY